MNSRETRLKLGMCLIALDYIIDIIGRIENGETQTNKQKETLNELGNVAQLLIREKIKLEEQIKNNAQLMQFIDFSDCLPS